MYCDADSDTHSADEIEKQQPTTKKKPKSKPFQGHGIGYHQGKTVVIKLSPETRTYKITNTIPRYHVFDHFSKTPQALSSTTLVEGTGAAKEIKYEYQTPEYNIEDYKKDIQSLSYDNNNFTAVEPKMYINNYLDKPLNIPIRQDDVQTNDKKVQTEHSEAPAHEDDNADKVGGDTVNKAIDRLGKIIKTHVYPSQTHHRIANDLEVYKFKPDYSEFLPPTTHYKSDPVIAEVDEAFLTKVSFLKPSDTLEASIDKEYEMKWNEKIEKDNNKTEIRDKNNLNSPHYDQDTANVPDYIEDTSSLPYYEKRKSAPYGNQEQENFSNEKDTIYKYEYPLFKTFLNYKPQSYYNDEENSKEIDSSYKSNLPKYSDEEDLEHAYVRLKEVGGLNRHEPASREVESSYRTWYPLHTLNKVKEEIFKTPHKATLENIERYYDPKNKDATAEENGNANDKYNKASYTQSVPNEGKVSSPQKLQLVADSKTIQIHGKLPAGKETYHLFGVLVPVTHNWSKVNHDQHKGGYSIQKNKSSKDNT